MQSIHYMSAAIVALVLLLLIPFASTQCPSDKGDWLLYNESCYKLYNKSQFWYPAEMHCASKNGHLVSIDNDFENRLVGRLSHCHDVWIGSFATDLSRRTEPDGYSWTEGAIANYSRNNFTVPPTYHEPLIRANNLYWYNSLYHESHPYMCEVRATSDTREKCPSTMDYFQGKCYFMSDFEATFVEANYYCQNHSTHLTSVLTEAELRFLNSLDLDIEACQIENMWLGLIKLDPCFPDRGGHQHCYQWTDYSGMLTSYPTWAEGHPSPPVHVTEPGVTTDRNCVTLFGNQLVSTSCSERHRFICKAGTDTLQPGTPAWTNLDHPPEPMDEEELKNEIATANGTFNLTGEVTGFNLTGEVTPTEVSETEPTTVPPEASPESSPTASPESSPTASPESSPTASPEVPPTSPPEPWVEPAKTEPVATTEPPTQDTMSAAEAEERGGSDKTSSDDNSRR